MEIALLVIDVQNYFFAGWSNAKLARQDVRRICLCAAMTRLRVETTARDGFVRGFALVMIADARLSKSPAFHKASLMNLGHGFAEIVNSADLAI